MGWRCFLLESRPSSGTPEYRPGAMWFAKRDDPNDSFSFIPTKEFLASTRNPLWVMLPGPRWTWKDDNGEEQVHNNIEYFCLDQRASDTDSGWTYTGVPPNITLSPSINCVGRYHGFIQNGIITPCVEGHKFPHWPEDV